MSFSIISGWMFVEKRKLVQVLPESVRKLWNVWELRVMVLLSLSLQISLISFGSRRKHTCNTWIRIFLYCSYLMADWVSTVALGVILNQQGENVVDNDSGERGELAAFWAPFLLLHLGGPDTITAYALADNDLWLRHVISLTVQAAVSIYIILMAWRSNNWLSYLSVPMFLAGIIKYGERSWVLRSANREQFRRTLLTDRDQGDSSYAMFMDEFSLKRAQGYHVTVDELVEVYIPPHDFFDIFSTGVSNGAGSIPDKDILLKAYSFFQTFKRLFVDIIVINSHSRDESQSFFQRHNHRTAFKVIEAELGFAYDVLYTKAPVIYTRCGFFFRFITSSFTFLVFVAFSITIGLDVQKHERVDLVITYILLGGAIVSEIAALVSLLSSDWTNLWLGIQTLSSWSRTPFLRAIMCLQFHQKKKIRWSKSTNQYNLLMFCLHHKPVVFGGILKSLVPMHKRLQRLLNYVSEKRENMRQLRYRTQLSDNLEALIFEHFLEMSQSDTYLTSLCTSRGGLVLEQHGFLDQLGWTTNVDFDHSLLIWHVATDICFHLDASSSTSAETKWLVSKQLSDYMLYLLVMCPWVMPLGIGMIRFRDTCAEANELFEDKNPTAEEASKILKEMTTKVNGNWSESVLFDACKLASALQKMENKVDKWEMVSDVWVEMMGYAASQCVGYDHAKLLEKGGELLSHVWLLMAHLAITEQFQISHGRARADLVVK